MKLTYFSSSNRYPYIWDFLEATSGIFWCKCFMAPHSGGDLPREKKESEYYKYFKKDFNLTISIISTFLGLVFLFEKFLQFTLFVYPTNQWKVLIYGSHYFLDNISFNFKLLVRCIARIFLIPNLVTGAARQKLKQAFLLSVRSSSAARKQHTALTWQAGSLPLSRIRPW